MPLARQLSVLSIYDVLTTLIPGATVLLAGFLLFPVEDTAVAASSGFLVFALLIGSLLVGHFVQWLRSQFGKQPDEFQRRMNAVRNENPETSIDEDALEMANQRFDIDEEVGDTDRLRLILSHLETRPAVRALRFQAIYSFYRSLVPASLLGVCLSLAALLLKCLQSSIPVRGTGYILVTLFGSIIVAFVSRNRRDDFEALFIGYAIREFYADQLEEQQQGNAGAFGSD